MILNWNVVIHIYFVLFYVFASTRAQCTRFKMKEEYLNKRLIGHRIKEVKFNTVEICVRECFYITKCKSFDFHPREKTCKLNDVDSNAVEKTEFEVKPGAVFSDIKEWPQVMAGVCGSKPCKKNQRCIRDYGEYHCIEEMYCGSVPAISDGTVSLSGSTNKVGSTAKVSCNDGFSATQEWIGCQANGTWEIPYCVKRDCGVVPAIADGKVSLTDSTTKVGSTAKVSCNDGFDANQEWIGCQAKGTWEIPYCVKRDCGSVPAVSDGTVRLSDSTTTVGSTATVRCNDEFDASQELITCQANGTWEIPYCFNKHCAQTKSTTKSCSEGWKTCNESCYFFEDSQRRTFQESRNFCKELGADLLHVEDEAENDFIVSIIRQTGREWLIGLTDEGTEGVWRWIDTNATAEFLFWHPGQPGGGTGENYVVYGNRWNDVPNDYKDACICEKILE